MTLPRIAAAILLVSIGLSVTAAEVPLADFARHAQFRDVKLSPNGDYLAASAIIDGKAILSLIHIADMKGVNLRPRENKELAEFWWASDNRVLYTIGERYGALEAPMSTGELYAVNADGTGDANIFGFRVGNQGATHIRKGTSRRAYAVLVDTLRDEPRHSLIATYAANGAGGNWSSTGAFPDIERIDLYTGATTRVTTSPMRNAHFFTDHHGVVRFAYGRDNDQHMKTWYRTGNGKDWELVFDEGKDGRYHWPIAFNRNEDGVYMSCEGQHRRGGLCRWDVATRTLKTLWSGSVGGVEGFTFSSDDHDIVALRSMPGRAATTLLDRKAPEADLLAELAPQFAGEDVQITSASRDGSRLVFLVGSDRNPGQFFLYDARTRKATLLFARRPWIKPEQMAAMEPIALKSRDGLDLHGYLTRPADKREAKALPLVVYAHGGPYGVRDYWEFDPQVQMLASRGYAVLQINFRGSGGYGDEFMKAGYLEWGAKMQDDVTDATRWAIAQGIADPKRICIFGASYGGYAALQGVVKEPDLYQCAIGYVGVYDLDLMYTRGDIPQSMYGDNYLKMVLGEDQAVLRARSPAANVARIKAKLMLIVGGQDQRVPPVQGQTLRSALNKAHIDHEWLYQRTEGHGFYDEGNTEDMFAKIEAFLDSSVGAVAK
jgi:dipeptidyl aminopeptidase/acylaminoacyl peptidase